MQNKLKKIPVFSKIKYKAKLAPYFKYIKLKNNLEHMRKPGV